MHFYSVLFLRKETELPVLDCMHTTCSGCIAMSLAFVSDLYVWTILA